MKIQQVNGIRLSHTGLLSQMAQPKQQDQTSQTQQMPPQVMPMPAVKTGALKPAEILDTALKYSGAAALALTPIAIAISGKSFRKYAAATEDKLQDVIKTQNEKSAEQFNKLNKMITQTLSVNEKFAETGEKLAKKVLSLSDETADGADRISDAIKDLAIALAAGTGAGAVFAAAQSSSENQKSDLRLHESTKSILEGEATTRIRGQHKWHKTDGIKGWMISAETMTFMKIGGLADVAVQLSDVFNKKYCDNKANHIDIVTPLYLGGDKDKKQKTVNLEEIDENNFIYTGAQGNSITLKKTASFTVEVHNGRRFKHENVEVLTGELNGTKYIFLKNDKYFNISPSKDCKKDGPYVLNVDKIDEVERMVFFSKAVYELMKLAKKMELEGGQNTGVEAPNTIIANDWHTSALSTCMRYLNPVERDFEKTETRKKIFEYIDDTPVIHITHNAAYQGNVWGELADRTIKLLLGRNIDKMQGFIKGYNEEGYPLTRHLGNYNEYFSDLHLADRIVAVSPNYAKEICTESMGAGTNYIGRIRADYGTQLGIVNGYTKSLAEPNQEMINNIKKLGIELKPFDNKYNDEGLSIKLQNKRTMIDALNKIAEQSAKGEQLPFTLYKPESCEIPANIDVAKTPFLTSVGRMTRQKGYDYLSGIYDKGGHYISGAIEKIYENLKPGQEWPIITINGTGEEDVIKNLQRMKDTIARKHGKEAANRIFILIGYSEQLRDALNIASDFFMLPSRWEPCGLTQMQSMAVGSLPVASATGGLVDTIEDGKDGFLTDVFYDNDGKERLFCKKGVKSPPSNNSDAITLALRRALDTYYNSPDKIKEMTINAMKKDFSWDAAGGSLEKYENLFRTGKI